MRAFIRSSAAVMLGLTLFIELGGGLAAQAKGSLRPIDHFDKNHLPTLAGRIDRLVQDSHSRGDFNGSVLVAQNAETIYEAQFGWADIAGEVPNSATTRHRLGSIGKQFTSTAILILLQDGKLKLDDTVAEHLPSFDWKPAKRVTLEQLIRHTSGVPRSVLDYVRGGIKKRYTLEQLLDGLQKAKLEFEPGERWQYSNAGYTILAGVVSAASGQSYNEFLRKRIFEPALMIETHFDFPEFEIEADGTGYYATASGKLRLAQKISMSFGIGAGTFRTTPADMVRWDSALRLGKVLDEETRALLYSVTEVSGGYACGWEVGNYARPGGMGKGLRAMHGGGIDGWSTSLIRLMDDGIVVVLMANLANAPVGQLAEEVVREILQAGSDSGVDRVQLALRSEGIEAATSVCELLTRNDRGRLASMTQMIGEPDADSRETYGCCWFPSDRDGQDVVELEYAEAHYAVRIEVHGTFSQGGLQALSLRDTERSEWIRVPLTNPKATRKSDGLGATAYVIEAAISVNAVRFEIDSSKIEGANVIDAVALILEDGTKHWAKSASATSDRSADSLLFSRDAPSTPALVNRSRLLREAGHLADALLIAQFNVTREPDSWRVHASLGRALRVTGASADSIVSFERALDLKPDDRAARKAIMSELSELR